VQGSEQAHGISRGRILLYRANDEVGYRRVRQEVLPLKHMVKVMLY